MINFIVEFENAKNNEFRAFQSFGNFWTQGNYPFQKDIQAL
ncbi:hypothetical protein EDO6_03002 [Paenibacillus xylanexedens]|nr:hypothetical protein EDO6_03002 [Paenibacillus xylanexedens]